MSGQPPRAVVSGLGPNGVMAALELLGRGYHVVVVEKRLQFTRPIHLHLRTSYLDDVERLSPELHRRLMTIATPIIENSRLGGEEPLPAYPRDRRVSPREGDPCPVWSRLSTPPERHVRLNNAEELFSEYLRELAESPESRLRLKQGYLLTLRASEDERYQVRLRQPESGESEDLGAPELVVIAEGGKSTTVQQLQLENVRFSYPKYFMSAHVAIPFGPRTRRIDTDLRELLDDPSMPSVELSLWASGHGESDEGTWIVLEVPEILLNQQPEETEHYFLRGAMRLMKDAVEELPNEKLQELLLASLQKGALLGRKTENLPGVEAASKPTFAGTFKFEQQCLRCPVAGKNVVVLGDAAGMGHHALSSGLEMGALDLVPLGELSERLARGEEPEKSLSRYADAVFQSRLKLLAIGMNEYYPNSTSGRLKMLQLAAELTREDSNA